jgi:pimeloyl-ACP methyl ester carboxylesterase
MAAANKPWIWRTEFFDDTPAVDLALLARGYHVAYIDMQDMYGSPASMTIMDKFYDRLTTQGSLSGKCVLEGFSRGGLFALNWAALRPEHGEHLRGCPRV